jgi:Golgi phosphoprotein 3 (GPP34)
VATLSGTGRLADDLYLMAHHDVSGRPLLQPRAAGLGLAGALLAELMLLGNIRVGPDRVTVADAAPPRDALAGSVLRAVLGERELHPAQTWLLYLARTAARDVSRRLAWSGYLTSVRRWRGERWVPVDADSAFAPLTRVKSALDPSRPLNVHGTTLAGLAAACGLHSRLSLYLPPRTGPALTAAVARLDLGLRELIAQTQAAVDSAVLSHRV